MTALRGARHSSAAIFLLLHGAVHSLERITNRKQTMRSSLPCHPERREGSFAALVKDPSLRSG